MRSRLWQWAAVAIWFAVLGVTAWAAIARRDVVDRAELIYAPFLSYELQPGTSATFVVPADIQRVRLISRSTLPDAWMGRPGDPIDYAVTIEWIGDAGRVVLDHTFWESSGVSRMPGPGLSVWQNAWLTDSSSTVTDDRVTLVPLQTVLPHGGYLRISAPPKGETLYVRLYGEEIRGTVDAGLKLFGPSNQLQQGLLHRVGLPSWALLDRGERRALTRTVWKSLSPDAATREALEPRWMYRSDVHMSQNEQRLAFQTLGARRSLAINLVGPAEITLSGQADVSRLRVTWVGLTDDAPVERAADPIAFAGAARGRAFTVPEGPGSIVFENPDDTPIGPVWWTLDEIRSHTLFGMTDAARIATMAPPGAWTGDDVVLVGPEINALDAWWVGEERDLAWSGTWPPGGDVLQLLVRAVLQDADDVRPRTMRVTGWDALGRKVWTDAATFDPVPAPFELLHATDRWLSEPIVTWVPVDGRITRITVSSRDGLVAILRGKGAPQGDPDFYPLPDDSLTVRYPRRPVTTWRTIDPDGPLPETRRARVLANVRLEPAGARRTAKERQYTTLTPVSAPRAPRVWLTPLSDPRDPTTRGLYCRYDPGGSGAFPRDGQAVAALDGVLSGVLWTAGSSSLGQTYRIGTDGATWQQGRLSQRVYTFRSGREPERRRVSYEGPAGSVLWMRTVASPMEGCPDPHESRQYWTLEVGERVVYEVTRTIERQVFAIGALGPSDAQLWVHVDDGQTLSTGLHPSWTKKQRVLDLNAVPGDPAGRPLDDPDTIAPMLAPRGLVLGSNLAGARYRITVENVSGTRVHVRALLESPGGPAASYGIDEVGTVPIAVEEE